LLGLAIACDNEIKSTIGDLIFKVKIETRRTASNKPPIREHLHGLRRTVTVALRGIVAGVEIPRSIEAKREREAE